MSTNRRGVILILVLVVVAMLALASMTFCELMLNERRAAETAGRQARARSLAQSGAEVARQFLDRAPDDQLDAGGLYDNSQRFGHTVAAPDPTPQQSGYFSVIAPKYENNSITGVRYGLQDESMRINLNTLLAMDSSSTGGAAAGGTASSSSGPNPTAKATLMALPNMTDEIADAILDWLDADDTPRDNGAESDYYGSLTPPYAARNGPIQSIDELLLVRGVTPQLLYGLDAAPMGLVDASTGDPMAGVDNSDGSMDHGWAAYFTLYSAETTLKSDGTQKINLNGNDLQQLYSDLQNALDENSAMFIVLYRNGGVKTTGNTTGQSSANTVSVSSVANQVNISALKASVQLTSVLDLIGATATYTPAAGTGTQGQRTTPRQIIVKSPFTEGTMASDLPKLMENTTTSTAQTIQGRININQAPRPVLLCIPGMTADLADQIIAKRIEDPKNDSQDHRYETWPLSEGIVPLTTMKSMLPFVTAGGSVYRAQILGSFEGGGPTARLEVILDASNTPTKVLFWKDMSRLPTGFTVESAARAAATNNP
jgi:DNA uptake protein ComE-like DNA-binding protein